MKVGTIGQVLVKRVSSVLDFLTRCPLLAQNASFLAFHTANLDSAS